MTTYRIEASSVEYYYVNIEADSEEQAWEIAYGLDGGDYKSYANGDWQIDSVTEYKERA